MTDEPAAATYLRSVEELLDLTLTLRYLLARDAARPEAVGLLREVGVLGERVKRLQASLGDAPEVLTAAARLRHAAAILNECTAILEGRPHPTETDGKVTVNYPC